VKVAPGYWQAAARNSCSPARTRVLRRITSHAVEALSSEPELRPALKADDEHIRLAVADAVRAGKRDGGVRVSADAAALA
jgi:hypothetical protein